MPSITTTSNQTLDTRHHTLILDCDGVLVDSEPIGQEVLVEMIGELGGTMTIDDAYESSRGRSMAHCVEVIEALIGRRVPDGWVLELRARTERAFEERLRPVDGIVEALDRIDMPICVASSGPRHKIELTLRLTGLLDRFEGRIFSAYEVGCWKPDPGLFLHAARAMGSEPARCIVVEDSLPGILAAVAAGMRALGYATGAYAKTLADAGAETFGDMRELGRRIENVGEASCLAVRGSGSMS